MATTALNQPDRQPNNVSSQAPRAILAAGLLCGVMDLSAAFITAGLRGVGPIRLLQAISSGLLGARSFSWGWRTAALGAVIHFLIAFSAATVFYLASRKLTFMTGRPIVSGILYGVAVYLVMYWVVVPLSNLHRQPFSWSGTLIAIITHMVCVGTPISLMVRRYSK
jgi:hypothetical protein